MRAHLQCYEVQMFPELPMNITQSQKELLAVAAIGAGLAAAFRYLPVVSRYPIAAGTVLYVVGYVARGQRPAGGWPQLEG